MKSSEYISTNPVGYTRSVRGEEIRVLTSGRAGKILPISYVPILREDSVRRGSVRVAFDMSETIHPLMNAVNVTVYAHFVPFLAFPRFMGSMDVLNRAYTNEPEPQTGSVVPFVHSGNFNRNGAVWKTLGVHWKQGESINLAPVEAYNTVVNFRRKARSDKLPQREPWDPSLAAAFWKNPNMAHIVPDFDQAAMDGEVELQFATDRLPVRGIGLHNPVSVAPSLSPSVRMGTGETEQFEGIKLSDNDQKLWMKTVTGGAQGNLYAPDIWTELADSGVRLSLANIELAKQTAAFAKLRKDFSGLDDEHIIGMLMSGLRVPDEALKQPILLDKKSTIFGYSERHAMDGASLDQSVTTGSTSVDIRFRTPPMNVGGVIIITAEIVPEQLYERLYDTFLGTFDSTEYPDALRDYLDPEKVSVVRNKFVDVEHSTPDATFGYAPLNHEWQRSFTRVGGKYYRRNPDQFVEDRQRFWSVEKLNPKLTEDFYLVGDLPHTVFVDPISDPFEVLALGKLDIVGLTQFGKGLHEDSDDYQKIMDQVDTDRINQDEA